MAHQTTEGGAISDAARSLKTEEQAAELLAVSMSALRAGRQGKGDLAKLPYVRLGRAIRYADADIERHIAARRVIGGGV